MVQLTDLQEIIGLEIKSINEVITPNTRIDWIGIERKIMEYHKAPSLPAYLLYEYLFVGKSIYKLAGELEIRDNTSLKNMMEKMGIPILTRRESVSGRRHPHYGKPISEEHISKLTMSRQSAGFYQSNGYRKKMSKAMSGGNNPNYGKTPSDMTRLRISASVKKLWQIPEYATKQIERLIDNLPTYHGYRIDTNTNAKSMMEANLERAIVQSSREYERGVKFRLEDNSNECTFFVDFSTITKRGNKVYYEIIAHPFEEGVNSGYAKLKLLATQSDINIKIVTNDESYDKCRKYFADEIQKGNLQVIPYSKYEEHFMPRVNADSLIREVHQEIVKESDISVSGYKETLRKKLEEYDIDMKGYSEIYSVANPPKFCAWEITGFNLTTHPNLFNPENR